MHTDNGLLFELLNSSDRNDCVAAVASAVEEYLDSLSQRFTLVPAGTNVDFDIDFLKRLGLDPDRWLSYRKFDLTTLRRYLTFLDCPEDPYEGIVARTGYATASDATSTTTSDTAHS